MIDIEGAGIDAIACSANASSPVADALGAVISDQIGHYLSEGHQVAAAVQNGCTGVRIASLFFGHTDDYVMLDLKGSDCDRIARLIKRESGGITCSRLDCKFDAKGFPKGFNPARAAETRLAERGNRPAGRRQIATATHCDSNGGVCFYTGSPSSDSRNRLYDKHAESPHLYRRGTFRYEHQARRRRADNIWRGLTQATEHAEYCVEVVRGAFEGHGTDMEFLEGVQPRSVAVPRPETSVETFLIWFGRCIRPTMVKYALAGHEARILAEFEAIRRLIDQGRERSELLSVQNKRVFRPLGSRDGYRNGKDI